MKPPSDLHKTLSATPKITAIWRSLTPVAQRDFISWIEAAKRPETRERRIKIAHSKLLAGKRRPCCYAIVPMNFYKALGQNPKAKATWGHLTPMEKRDFVVWATKPKKSETEIARIASACRALASGKRHP